jgi:hypothetical protein
MAIYPWLAGPSFNTDNISINGDTTTPALGDMQTDSKMARLRNCAICSGEQASCLTLRIFTK